jgi:hypothetical protein
MPIGAHAKIPEPFCLLSGRKVKASEVEERGEITHLLVAT